MPRQPRDKLTRVSNEESKILRAFFAKTPDPSDEQIGQIISDNGWGYTVKKLRVQEDLQQSWDKWFYDERGRYSRDYGVTLPRGEHRMQPELAMGRTVGSITTANDTTKPLGAEARFGAQKLQLLEAAFQKYLPPSKVPYDSIARDIGLTDLEVKNWFIVERAKIYTRKSKTEVGQASMGMAPAPGSSNTTTFLDGGRVDSRDLAPGAFNNEQVEQRQYRGAVAGPASRDGVNNTTVRQPDDHDIEKLGFELFRVADLGSGSSDSSDFSDSDDEGSLPSIANQSKVSAAKNQTQGPKATEKTPQVTTPFHSGTFDGGSLSGDELDL
ncbi:hypothetical protein EG329_013861 [Mollisiaceae sp. DMI_Dod_QoI]|nr:hypothetical protein EG329_013861 [Helotiales sp. DMI_Dod_QoI]